MSIEDCAIKLLWSLAAGRCSFTDCWERVSMPATGEAAAHTKGEMAHIQGNRKKSNRHNPKLDQKSKDDYSNLILLCPNHHTEVDRPENESRYTVDKLLEMKAQHEDHVSRILESPRDRITLGREILSLLMDNRAVWSHSGPNSKLAAENPNSDESYALWVEDRLTIIAPNNRKIVKLLESAPQLLETAEQESVAEFKLHQRTYELWVRDQVSYSMVRRFPEKFEQDIRRLADGS